MQHSIRAFIGLGNIGKAYEKTKHNIGFLSLNFIAKSYGCRFKNIGFGFIAKLPNKILLFKPKSFMNICGEKVGVFCEHFNITPEELCIIHDDMDIPLSKIRIKRGGGDAGHKGIKSISENLQSKNFLRIRVGIGRPSTISPTDWVLSEYQGDLSSVLDLVKSAVETIIECGEEKAMNLYNRKNS